MYVVVGLGNPGNKYRGTRHNVGFDTIDCMAEMFNVKLNKIKYKSVYGETNIGGEKVLLVKPQTYMNNSGQTVLDIYNFFKLPIDNIIVIYDDIDIEFGTIRIRKKGSAGSHNGMRSIIYLLKNDQFPRIRIGVGKPEDGRDLVAHVLGKFGKENRPEIDSAIERAAKAAQEIIKSDVEKAMNLYNG